MTELLNSLVAVFWVAFLTILAYWHRDQWLYYLAGLATMAYGFLYFTTDYYVGILLVCIGIYDFVKGTWDRA